MTDCIEKSNAEECFYSEKEAKKARLMSGLSIYSTFLFILKLPTEIELGKEDFNVFAFKIVHNFYEKLCISTA